MIRIIPFDLPGPLHASDPKIDAIATKLVRLAADDAIALFFINRSSLPTLAVIIHMARDIIERHHSFISDYPEDDPMLPVTYAVIDESIHLHVHLENIRSLDVIPIRAADLASVLSSLEV